MARTPRRLHDHRVRSLTLTLVTECRRACPEARTDRALVVQAMRWLSEAVSAGIDVIQIRERDMAASTLRDLTRAVVAAAQGTPTRVLVNDRADVALISGAHGVHLRDDGWSAAQVRSLNPAWILGRSVHNETTVEATEAVDFVVFGAVFGSAGKPERGVGSLRAVVDSSPVPVVAIGGVTVDTAPLAIAAGATGVAAIRMFLPVGCANEAIGPVAAVSRLRAAIGNV
jgi:thiamine-phosphate pyrophosphorylase